LGNADRLSNYAGRFAPSPTGPLHFGFLVTAVVSYVWARFRKGRRLVRMEDVGRPGCQAQTRTSFERWKHTALSGTAGHRTGWVILIPALQHSAPRPQLRALAQSGVATNRIATCGLRLSAG
jgi:hypothetical protein